MATQQAVMNDGAEALQGLVPISQRDVTLMLEAGYLLMELQRHKEAEEVFSGVMSLLPRSEVPRMGSWYVQ